MGRSSRIKAKAKESPRRFSLTTLRVKVTQFLINRSCFSVAAKYPGMYIKSYECLNGKHFHNHPPLTKLTFSPLISSLYAITMAERKMDTVTANGTKTGSAYSGWSSIAKRYMTEVPKEDFERDSASQEWPRRRRNRRTGWITCCRCGKHGHRGRDCKKRFKGERRSKHRRS